MDKYSSLNFFGIFQVQIGNNPLFQAENWLVHRGMREIPKLETARDRREEEKNRSKERRKKSPLE